MTRPFRFGIQAFNAGSAQEWTDTAKAAEDLGYSCLHLADHYMGQELPKKPHCILCKI